MLCRTIAGGGSLTIEELDGLPAITGVKTIQISNGTVTDMGGGRAKIILPADIDGGGFQDTFVATNDIDGGAF